MKRLLFWLIVVAVIAGGAARRLQPFLRSRSGAGAGQYRTEEGPARRHHARGQFHRHREAGAERAGRGLRFRSHQEGLRGFQRQGQEEASPGADRPADLQGRPWRTKRRRWPTTRPTCSASRPSWSRRSGTERRALSLQPAKAISETDFDQSVTDREIVGGPRSSLARRPSRECEASPGHGQDEPRFHRDPLAGGRHRDRSQGRSGPDRGRPVPDARDVRGRPGPGEEGLRLRLGRRGGHRPDPRGPGAQASRSPSRWTPTPRTPFTGGSPRCGSTPRRSRTSSPTR